MSAVTINIAVGMTGAVPTAPAQINATLIALVSAVNQDYTANLPGSLVEDISSTDTYALALMDSMVIDLINSLTPDGANGWLLVQLGQIYGVPLGQNTNTSVYCVFTGTPGFQVLPGFTVGDGTYQYVVKDGGAIPTGGVSAQLFCVATQAGTWAVPANSVTTLITPPPTGITLSVTNPNTGTPQSSAQTLQDYRGQVLTAGLASAQGQASLVKTLLSNVTGVQPRLISLRQVSAGWEVICGGGDPYQVANAIYNSGLDLSTLVGSSIVVASITNANPGVAATTLNHGLTTGQTGVHIVGATGMTLTGGPYTVTVIDEKTFSFGVNTTSLGTYTANSGTVTPNPRNISVNLNNYPDIYTVPFVNPPQQTVQVQLTWNTNSPNLVSASAVAQLGAPALANYINSIPVGAPINEFELQAVFQAAIVSLVDTVLVSRMVFTISINGVATSPDVGTGLVEGDPESYFFTTASAVVITQG